MSGQRQAELGVRVAVAAAVDRHMGNSTGGGAGMHPTAAAGQAYGQQRRRQAGKCQLEEGLCKGG